MAPPASKESVVVARRLMFSSAHFYKQERFTDEENRRVFGACYTPNGHGHNYVVEAFVSGPIDSDTKLVINLDDLDRMLLDVTRPLEHRHLNFDVPEFKSTVPTTENIALYLRRALLARLDAERARFPNLKLNRLRLYETDDLWVEVRA